MAASRLLRVVLATLVVAGAAGGCALLPERCEVAIWGWPAEVVVPEPGEPAPTNIEPLAIAGDVDWAASGLSTDQGLEVLDLVLTPAAAARMADHTNSGAGTFLVIALNGEVVAAPMVQEQIRDGRLRLSPGDPGSLAPFAPCVGR